MNCRQVRKQLPTGAASEGLKRHIAACEDCARLAARLETARQLFLGHRSDFTPDAGFAARVGEQLPIDREDSLSWAAVRVLPVTLALLAVLVWFSWSAPGPSLELTTSPTDDLLSWVIDGGGDVQ